MLDYTSTHIICDKCKLYHVVFIICDNNELLIYAALCKNIMSYIHAEYI